MFDAEHYDYDNAKQALFLFTGDVYKSLEAESLTKKEILLSQNNLRIISGLYGLIRPLVEYNLIAWKWVLNFMFLMYC